MMVAVQRDLPSGTVTFLFTDVEGSTRLLHELRAEGHAVARRSTRHVLREAFGARDGVEVDTQGDAFFVAFPTVLGRSDGAGGAPSLWRHLGTLAQPSALTPPVIGRVRS